MASKEQVKEQRIWLGFCAVICVSAIGGYIYFVNRPPENPNPRRIVNMEETIDEDYQKMLDNIIVSPTEQAIVDANTIKETVEKTKENIEKGVGSFIDNIKSSISSKASDTEGSGYDKNGNPYLKKGASYTFKADGTPVEAPANGNYVEVISPVNGKKYAYGNFSQKWSLYVLDDDKAQARAEANREINAMGEKITHRITEEEANEFSKNMSINVGSMGY